MLCGPKTGARFWTQKWGHNTKISSPASKFVAPILGPWYMRFAFCKECVELRQDASSIHVFLRMVPGCGLHSTTDMCCCQLASEAAHLLPVLTSSCLCFVAPKQGPDSGSKNGATILKLVSPASQILGPWYMRFAFCKECVELRQVASSIHVFLRLVPGFWFHMQGTQ